MPVVPFPGDDVRPPCLRATGRNFTLKLCQNWSTDVAAVWAGAEPDVRPRAIGADVPNRDGQRELITRSKHRGLNLKIVGSDHEIGVQEHTQAAVVSVINSKRLEMLDTAASGLDRD